MDRLKGKIALVTGAGRGIGRGIALAYGREGASVVVASRSSGTVDTVVAEIEETGGTAWGTTCDVGQRDQVFGAIDEAAAKFGAIDILVNVAQGVGPSSKPTLAPPRIAFEDIDEDEWEYTFRTGATASMWAMKAVFPHMKGRGGRIINFGSYGGQVGFAGIAPYNATKEAIRAITRTAAQEWGSYNITVNTINPLIHTEASDEASADNDQAAIQLMIDAIPTRRWGTIDDITPLAVFLASDDAPYLTGQTYAVDGGAHELGSPILSESYWGSRL